MTNTHALSLTASGQSNNQQTPRCAMGNLYSKREGVMAAFIPMCSEGNG